MLKICLQNWFQHGISFPKQLKRFVGVCQETIFISKQNLLKTAGKYSHDQNYDFGLSFIEIILKSTFLCGFRVKL